MPNEQEYTKGFLIGTLVGGAIGAAVALLTAPKSGRELRGDIQEKSNEYYNKASNKWAETEEVVGRQVTSTVNEGRAKAQSIIDSAKQQANELLYAAENVLNEAKTKAGTTKSSVQNKIDDVRSATKAGVETFKSEINESKN
ncbi:MAG: YtxH domain-containing protein [Chlorobiota bacterium]